MRIVNCCREDKLLNCQSIKSVHVCLGEEVHQERPVTARDDSQLDAGEGELECSEEEGELRRMLQVEEKRSLEEEQQHRPEQCV